MGFQAMRVRMATEASVENLINTATIPVRIDITDIGMPEGVPALRWHERALSGNPWIRRRFGHYVLIDAWGEEMLGVTFGQRESDALEPMIRDYKEFLKEREKRGPRTTPFVPDPNEPMPDSLKKGPLNGVWMTAYELSYDFWLDVVDQLTVGEGLAPGVRNSAIHTYADFLNEDFPYDLLTMRGVGLGKRSGAGRAPREPIPADRLTEAFDLKERAALAVVRIVGLPIEEQGADLVAEVRAWWAEHRDDEEFRIEWADDPMLRYSFFKGIAPAG